MADRFNIDRRRYGEFEKDIYLITPESVPDVGELQAHELCFIKRRRENMTQQQCADLIGVARYWLMLMETGKAPSDRLEAFWNER